AASKWRYKWRLPGQGLNSVPCLTSYRYHRFLRRGATIAIEVDMLRVAVSLMLLFSGMTALAQFAPTSKVVIEELGWMDRNYLERQIGRIDELARVRLGKQLNQNLNDLDVLQQIVDRELIDAKDTEGL